MSKMKKKLFRNPAFSKEKSTQEIPSTNLVTQTKANAFEAVFQTQALSEQETSQIEELLKSNFVPENADENQLTQDIFEIKATTQEIKSIGNQGAYLIGERIAKAREILKRYKKETFCLWLDSTFGARKTAYNFLCYYDLWRSLADDELRNKFKQMPRKAAYLLASRKVGLREKESFINKYYDAQLARLMLEVRKRFPSPSPKKRSPAIFSQLKSLLDRLFLEEDEYSKEEILHLKEMKREIGKMLMKYLAIPKPTQVPLSGKAAPNIKDLIKKAAFSGERFILQDKDMGAAIVPLEDLELLENEENN